MAYSIIMAAKIAKRAPNKSFRLGAVLMRGGNVLSRGHNIMASDKSIHAEAMCVNKADNANGATMVVTRIRKDGKLSSSKPCESCMKMLIDAGIKKIVFTKSDGSIETLRL